MSYSRLLVKLALDITEGFVRGHPGRGAQGACGKDRKRDGSGKGIGNIKRLYEEYLIRAKSEGKLPRKLQSGGGGLKQPDKNVTADEIRKAKETDR